MDLIYDVAVIGAGPSGIAAAFYAAKFGAKTVLMEKDSVIGGTAFKAYVNTLKGQSLSAMDGLLNGITKKAWGSLIFDHEALLDRYYELLKTHPVSLLNGHEVISVETEGGSITSLLCAFSSGKAAVSAKIVIDATGALAVESLTGINDAGAPAYAYMTGLIGKVETVGGKCYSAEAKRLLNEKTAWAKENSKLERKLSFEINPTVRADIAHITIRYDNTEALSGNLMRKQMNAAAGFLQEFGYGFENASLICSSKEIFYSARGSFNAGQMLELSDITQNRYFSDQIAALPDDDGVGERVYYIPYGALLSKSLGNLLLCGRNIGAAANAIERIDSIPTHFETGKAAGIAAAIAVKNGIELNEVSPYEIKSKTEDSISDKIEILKEETGAEDGAGYVSPFDIAEASEDHAQALSFSASFREKENAGAESFVELDRMLELLGEDILKPDLEAYDNGIRQFQQDFDSSMEESSESPSVENPAGDRKSDLESLLDELGGYSTIAEGYEPPAEADETSGGDADGITEEPAESEAALSTEGAEPERDKNEAKEEAPVQQEEYSAEIESSFAALIDETESKEPPSEIPEEPHEQDNDERRPEHQEESTPPFPEETVEKEEGAVVFEPPQEPENEPEQPVEDAGPVPEDAAPKYEGPAEPNKNIVTSDDVINMLYEDEPEKESDISRAVRETPAYYIPDKKVSKDDISFLYEEEDEQKPEHSAGRKDRVDSMLDMIYEITEPSERPEDAPRENKPVRDMPAEEKSGALQDDKFKSLKDFLYDINEE